MNSFLQDSDCLPASENSRDGFALIFVMAGVVIVTLLVVVIFTCAALERRMAASHFERQKAHGLAMMAVDEVVGKLRDNIPAKSAWGVAPGRLRFWDGATWQKVDLHSGYSSGDRVALNLPLDDNGTYTLLSKNADFPDPPKMDVDWVYVFDDGTVGPTVDPIKRVVGRYAYWTDVETSKVNLNTAGKAQIDFQPKPPSYGGRGDMQNLSGHPSSVDLSQLDSVTSAFSTATYNAAGISAERDYVNNRASHYAMVRATPPPGQPEPAPPVGRFSSTAEWKRIVGNDIYEKNKFDITVQGRAPEFSPWGQHRLWLNRASFISNSPNTYSFSQPFPLAGVSTTDPDNINNQLTDTWDSLRFFVFPNFHNDQFPRYLNWYDLLSISGTSAASSPATARPQRAQIETMQRQLLNQLKRTDWPGFGTASFVQKYGGGDTGEGEAGCVAYNIIRAGDSLLSDMVGGTPIGSCVDTLYSWEVVNATDGSIVDQKNNAWGLNALNTPFSSGTSIKIGSTGRHPLVNEICLRFSTGTSVATGTYPETIPGFVGPPPAGKVNLRIEPRIEYWLPPGFAGPPVAILGNAIEGIDGGYAFFVPDGDFRDDLQNQNWRVFLTDIHLTSDGILDGTNVHYDKTWRYGDSGERGGRGEYAASPGDLSAIYPEADTGRSMQTNLLPPISIGPFDENEQVTATMSFRVAVVTRKDGVFSGMGEQGLMQIPPDPNDHLQISGTFDPLQQGSTQDHSLEISDPRLMSNLRAWQPSTDPFGATIGGMNSVFTSSSAYGDSSKLAYPDLTLTTLYGREGAYRKGNRMLSHNPVNIMGPPNIGWMSVISTGVFRNRPWSTLSLQPAQNGELPDWLILELMAMPYDQTYASHTEGKVNLNAALYPWFDTDPKMARRRPLAALLGNRVAGQRDQIIDNINNHTLAGSSFGLPSDVYIYAGQFCQVKGVSDTGADDFTKEQLPRDIIGLVTTQSADFKVHLVAQTLKQRQPGGSLVVGAEIRESVSISRTIDFGDAGYNPTDYTKISEGTMNTWPFMMDGSKGDTPRRRVYWSTGADPNAAGPDGILGTNDDLRALFRYNVGRIESLTP